ncbi:MAG: hypothetical protein ACTHYM_09085 [Actinomycetaceae bacterium]
MRLVSGLDVLWRGSGSSQVGTDPRCAVVIEGLSAPEQRLLEALDWSPTRADLRRRGAAEGLQRSQVDRLVELLAGAGVLTDLGATVSGSRETGLRPAGDGTTGDVQHRERAALAGVPPPPRPRDEAVVGVLGLGRTGASAASGLAAEAVGTLLLSDPGQVMTTDVLPYRPGDVGRARETCLAHDLLAASPRLRVTAPPGVRPDVALVVTHRVSDPPLLRRLAQEDVPHLVVVVGELTTTVGPLVRPGAGPCARCLDLERSATDPAWPAVATQVRVLAEAPESHSQATWAAGRAVREVLRQIDRPDDPHPLVGASVELGTDGHEVRRRWSVHPDCGCSSMGPR